MNRYLLKLTCFLFVLTMAWKYAEAADYTPASAFEYSIADNQVTITKFIGPQTEVSIPPTIEGKPVVAIEYNAFYNNTSLTSVTIPEGVTAIGDCAFQNCENLSSVTLPSSLESIGSVAFAYCEGLTSIEIPEGVIAIEGGAFYYCCNLRTVSIPSSVTYIGDEAFSGCVSLLCVEISPSVEYIGYQAFFMCENLRSVTIPMNEFTDGVIGPEAFSWCRGLVSVEIGAAYGRVEIEEEAFSYCENLRCVRIRSSLTEIGDGAFGECSELEVFVFSGESVPPALGNDCFSAPVTFCVLSTYMGDHWVGGIVTTVWEIWEGWDEWEVPDGVTLVRDSEQDSADYTYEIVEYDRETVTITGYNGSASVLVIPPTIEGKPVLAIGNEAFGRCENLTIVTLPESVQIIEDAAFYGCPDLVSVLLPTTVGVISHGAFMECESLISMTIPEGVTDIGWGIFDNCPNLVEVSFPASAHFFDGDPIGECPSLCAIHVNPGNEEYASVDGVLFDKSMTTLMKYPQGRPNPVYSIPYGVTAIGARAFHGCENLTSVTIPEGVTTIGDYAFDECYNLTSVTLPSSLESIGDEAFSDCGSLESIAIPASVTAIGNRAFSYCTSLEAIDVDSANTNYTSEDGVLFDKSMTTLLRYPSARPGTDYSVPSGVVVIGDDAFGYCSELTSITLPSGVTSIGQLAFAASRRLESITIPSSVTSIGDYAFEFCFKLHSITLPTGLTSIGNGVFYKSGLTSVTIPEGVTTIENSSFYDCSSLTSVTIPSTVTSIGNNAFCRCSSLTTVTIPSTVTTIGRYAFYGCGSLTEMEFMGVPPTFASDSYPMPITFYVPANMGWEDWEVPDGVTLVVSSESDYTYTIDDGKVTITGYKGSDTDIRIPSRIEGKPVVAIGIGAFNYSSLTSVTIPSSVTSIGNSAFLYCNRLVSVTIQEGVTTIGRYAFEYCRSLASVTIPSSVTSIGSSAFGECNRLASVTLSEGLGSIGNSAFVGCSRLTEITIPASVTSIEDNVFYGCWSLASITVDDENDYYTVVDGVLFNKSMNTLVCYPADMPGNEYSIPTSVTTIASGAFCGCNLSSVTISEGVTTIGSYAFSCCSLLPMVSIPSCVTNIGNGAFHACSSLVTITVDAANTCYASSDGILYNKSQNTLLRYPPGRLDTEYSISSSVTAIGYGAFCCCENLTTVLIPSTVKTIDECAFDICYGLTSMTIPEGVTTIGKDAFFRCENLTFVSIPSTVTSIGYMAFYGCNSLIDMEFMGIPPMFDSYSYPTPITFYVPMNMGWEEWEVPDGVTLVIPEDTPAQTINLDAGWNWAGFQVLPESHAVKDVLGTAGFTVNDVVQTVNGAARFTGANWIPSNFTIEYGRLYQIYTAQPATLTIEGDVCEDDSVDVSTGWNWVACPMLMTIRPEYLAHSGGWTAGDRIQTSGGASVTYTGSKWIPSTGFAMEPGKGYQIYTAKAGTVSFGRPTDSAQSLYAVVDLSGGADVESYPVRYTDTAPNLDDDTCRTTELWLRRIPAGTFIMGSPEDEVGRYTDETQHEVTLTQDYYIGVFECTQKQWELVMGGNPSYNKGDCRPVEYVSYDMIRGTGSQAGAGWPTYGHAVDATSFMGKLQEKTGLTFDLPTEAQWEYACRAGATTALNSGENLTSSNQDAAMDEVGRYRYNGADGKGGYSWHTKVGSYRPNAWGLYDMHGNVSEWCLDWYNSNFGATAVSDPVGPTTGWVRLLRGGSCASNGSGEAWRCRSACRISYIGPGYDSGDIGFRIAFLP